MDVGSMLFRHAVPQERKYLPYAFDGDWTPVEINIVKAVIDPHLSDYAPQLPGEQILVLPTFNNWLFYKDEWGYSARRATWDMGFMHAESIQELADKLAQYYAPNPLWEEDAD